ncbi:MAG: NAD(P)/FAD-dependent oxidoreductase [Dehalococcoidia bacterium]|nr:NAD(P)/FAD-dependent oxidoreductase [Dehalococcoidia bacterium]
MNVAVIGGGVAGMAAAYRLIQGDHRVSLYEVSPFLGGLVRTFEVGGGRLESFYHHLFSTDTTIVRLIEELGLGGQLTWRDSKVGFYHGGRLYDFVTPMDLLKFTPAPFVDRLRMGLAALYLRRQSDGSRYESVTAAEWVKRYMGRGAYDAVWGPLLRGKFGDAHDQLAMVWLWNKIYLRFASRTGVNQKEQLGYLLGSFGVYIDELERRLRESRLAEINTGRAVKEVVVEGGRARGLLLADGERADFDAVIACMPAHVFGKLAPQLPQDYVEKLTGVRWQWAMCYIMALKRSLSPIYWLNIADDEVPFIAAIEHTNFIERERYGGHHVVYLSNYLHPEHEYLQMDVDEIERLYLPHLTKINPAFSPDWIAERWLFKGPYAQPVVTIGYRERIPEHRTPIPGLYLATMSQIYPEDRGQNYSIKMGEHVASLAVEDFQRTPAEVGATAARNP